MYPLVAESKTGTPRVNGVRNWQLVPMDPRLQRRLATAHRMVEYPPTPPRHAAAEIIGGYAHRVVCLSVLLGLAENQGLHGLLIARVVAEELHFFFNWYPRYIKSPSHRLFCIICSFVGIISVNLFAGIILFFIFWRWFAWKGPRAAPTNILRLHLTPEAVRRPDAVPRPHG